LANSGFRKSVVASIDIQNINDTIHHIIPTNFFAWSHLMLKPLSTALLAASLLVSPIVFSAEKTSVTVSAPWEINSYDPAVSGFAFHRLQVMETLVDADTKGVLIPALATEWSAAEDGMSWSFTVREGVKFHNGTALTAELVSTSLNRAFEKPGILKKAPIKSIEAKDGNIVIQLEKPFSALPALLTHNTTVISAPASMDAEGNVIGAIGTGAFIVDTFTPPQSVTLKRNDNYWGKKATLETVSYLASSRAETRALMAESGDADLVFNLDPSGFAHLKDVDSVKTSADAIPRVVILKLNASHKFLDDARARQALSMSINRQGIATAITRFPEASATQLFPPVLSEWHNKDLKPLTNDVEAAKKLLADLGWKAGDDGILTRNGERFKLLLRTFPDRPELPLIATALQAQWGEIGVELEVSVSSYSEIPKGHKDGSLEVALFARNYGLTPDPIGTTLQDFGKGGGDWGAMGWENAKVADALDSISQTSDAAVRTENIATVAKAVHDELPLIPVVWYQHTVSVAKDLKGYVVDPLERSYGLNNVSWGK
jgi:peptide/nickel transport system substrate-binding protein